MIIACSRGRPGDRNGWTKIEGRFNRSRVEVLREIERIEFEVLQLREEVNARRG